MSESATDTSDKTSETSESSESETQSESESESESSEESSDATPKAESGDEAKDEQEAGAASTTSAASKSEEESVATPEPPPTTTTEVTDEKVPTGEVVVTGTVSETSEEFSITLHAEGEPSADTSAAEVTSVADVEQPSAELRVENVARVVGQVKSDVISQPEVKTDDSEVHQVYRKTVYQVRITG